MSFLRFLPWLYFFFFLAAMEDNPGEEGMSIEEVMRRDAEFRAAAAAHAVDPTHEVSALKEIFEGEMCLVCW
jgi:hypothetical protein